MSEKIDDGGTAFPYREEDGRGGYVDHFGMTLRDYFAAAALQPVTSSAIQKEITISYEDLALNAYIAADAMIARRKEGNQP